MAQDQILPTVSSTGKSVVLDSREEVVQYLDNQLHIAAGTFLEQVESFSKEAWDRQHAALAAMPLDEAWASYRAALERIEASPLRKLREEDQKVFETVQKRIEQAELSMHEALQQCIKEAEGI